jgi:hypothetical protein
MVTRIAAGQEKHAPPPGHAQKLALLMQSVAHGSIVAKAARKCHMARMCFHATISGAILPVWSKTAYDEVMLHCARIGFKP